MEGPFPPLKLSNKGMEEYSKNIHFILFYSLLPNRALIVQSMLNDDTKRSSIGLASTFIFEFSDAPFITF